MILRLIVKALLKDKNSYTRAVKLKGRIYTITIKQYESVEEQLKKLRSALEKDNT